jgi:hypothetical protein
MKNRQNVSYVPGTGFEPARPFEHHHLKVACLPISTPGLKGSKCKVPARPHQIFFKTELRTM